MGEGRGRERRRHLRQACTQSLKKHPNVQTSA
jgi:hypothetical protein